MPIKLENYKERLIDKTIELYLKTFKAIQIVGPKWCGKTWTSMHHGNSIVRLTDIEKRKLAILNPKLILNENILEFFVTSKDKNVEFKMPVGNRLDFVLSLKDDFKVKFKVELDSDGSYEVKENFIIFKSAPTKELILKVVGLQ